MLNLNEIESEKEEEKEEEIINEVKKINKINQINTNSILSSLFKEYQKKIEEDPLKSDKDKNNRNSIDNINISNKEFSKEINNKLEEIKKNSLSKIDNSIKLYNTNYDKYKNKLVNYINNIDTKLSKIYNNLKNEIIIKYAISNIFNKLNIIIEVFDNIMNNILSNFQLLNNCLENNDLIRQKNPIVSFLNKNYEDILNCSLLNKFNFNQINTSKIILNNYYRHFFNFLKEDKNDGVIRTFTYKRSEKNKGMFFLKDNFKWIKKLTMNEIRADDLERIFSENERIKDDILEKIKINDFDLSKKINLEKINELKLKKIKKLKFTNGKYLHPIYLSHFFMNTTKCLKNLTLEKINMSNIGLNALMNVFLKNEIFLKTLEYLSLAGNSISIVKNILFESDDLFEAEQKAEKSFEKLEIFNLHRNNIYKFDLHLDYFPKLKLLDLTSNSLLTGVIMDNMIKHKEKLILFNDNIFITNNIKNNNKYIEYLNTQLPNLEFRLKAFHLGFTYDMETRDSLRQLILSPSIKISLIKLDLSFCGLTTDILINFLNNNIGLFSLKNLKLRYNNIESDIFEKFISNDILIENLNALDLSENFISCKSYEENCILIKFIEKYQNLTQIKLMNSMFYKYWSNNTSIDFDVDGKFRELYLKFAEKIHKDNRKFIFIINSDVYSFIENEFETIFKFRPFI